MTAKKEPSKESTKQRIFDIVLNNELVESRFNMANDNPDKYGITIEALLKIRNNQGLRINLKALEGDTVMTGILIEKMN